MEAWASDFQVSWILGFPNGNNQQVTRNASQEVQNRAKKHTVVTQGDVCQILCTTNSPWQGTH